MAKFADISVLDGLLDIIATSTIMTANTALPTDRNDAVVTTMLANVVMVPVTDFPKAAGDTSGRKVTVAQKTGVAITNTGTAINVALCDATTLLFVTECTSQVLNAGGTVTFPAWDDEVADPI